MAATRKRVLVAEAADAVRQVVESILRQNGYDVLAVATAAKAAEVLQYGRPDLLVVGGDLLDASQKPFYDVVQSNPKTTSMPLLVIEPADKSSVSLPPEVVVSRPIEPKDFLHRISIFLGQAVNPTKQPTPSPLTASPVDDSFLDAALGLDRIDVTASEDMDQTSKPTGPPTKSAVAKVTPYDGGHEDEMSQSRKVEALHIRDDSSDIRPQNMNPPKKTEQSGTGKIEIMNDQYGIADPAAFQIKPERQVHDYDWFVSAMRDDVAAVETPKPPESQSAGKHQVAGKQADSQKLRVTETASMVDPLTHVSKVPPGHPAAGAGRNHSEGVEKFIDEFKKEIELLRSREPEPSVAPVPAGTPAPATGGSVKWDEQIESLSTDQIHLFSREFTRILAERLAERIISKIDPDKLLQLIKEEMSTMSKKKSSGA